MSIGGEFRELEEEVNKLKSAVKNSLDNIEDLRETWETLYQLINKVDLLLPKISKIQKDLLSTQVVDRAVDIFYRRALEEARDTLKQFVTEAANNSEEYSRPMLKEPLIKACDSQGAVTLKLTRNGWKSKIKATANLDAIMGSLELWGMAVSKVRDEWGFGEMTDPIKASAMWRDSIFLGHTNRNRKSSGGNTNASSKWSFTIAERLAMAGAPAPYWKLLNNGQMTSLSSDRGGIAYPKEAPTFFKERAEEQIERDFTEDLDRSFITWKQFTEKVEALWYSAEDLRSQLKGILDNMSVQINGPDYAELPIKKVVTAFNLREEEINYNKLLTAIEELVTTGNLITVKSTKAGRIEITVKGGPRKRISVRKLRAFLGG